MEATFEIFPSNKLKLDRIPDHWTLTVTATQESLTPTIETYRQLEGTHTPHISAALVESEDHARQLADIVHPNVFLIGGDLEPLGEFERAAELIPYFQHCEEIGVAGYPEGHPSYPNDEFGDTILQEKQELGATFIATQMAFKPEAIVEWVDRIRAQGITLPIHAGIAAPISVTKLTQFAMRSGVNTSLNFIRKMSKRDVAKMIQRYDPQPLMEAVYDHVDGFHVYTFNAIDTTAEWVESIPWLSTLTTERSAS
ncbi:MAG: methylenetetrahydrofolate reductase [Candidatus Bipolaricaulia bacterium]